ncbi:Uncharacterized protein APZ42_020895, partial [Daphnia magna]
ALPLLSSAKNPNVGINFEDESCTQVEFPELLTKLVNLLATTHFYPLSTAWNELPG